MGTLRDQTTLNIRERAGRRKQCPFRRPYSRSERIRPLFGILDRLERCRGLESHCGGADLPRASQRRSGRLALPHQHLTHRLTPERHRLFLRLIRLDHELLVLSHHPEEPVVSLTGATGISRRK